MYPSEDVRSAIAYIFLKIYSSNSISTVGIFSSIDAIVTKGILSVLKSGSTKYLIKTGLELLFEIISGKNELLIETIICCIRIFAHYSLFFEKCHILYGVNTLLDVAVILLKLKNWRLLCMVFDLLSILNSKKASAVVSSQSSITGQALKLVENSFKIHNPQVLLAVSNFFCTVLKNEHLPSSVSSQLFSIVQMCMKNFQKFFSSRSHLSAEVKNFHENHIENLPLEVDLLKNGLDILCCLLHERSELGLHCKSGRIAKQNTSCGSASFSKPGCRAPWVLRKQSQGFFRSEECFSCPIIEDDGTSLNTSCKNDFQTAVHACISALDEIFVPYCLLLNTNSMVKDVSHYHLVQVLLEIFEDPVESKLLTCFAKKLVKAKMFSHIWNIKISRLLLSRVSFEESSTKCNHCLASLLKFLLQKHKDLDTHMETIKIGLVELNCPIDECSSVLSQKCEPQSEMTASPILCSVQMTLLCLCYVTYLNDAPIVKTKTLTPHLVYYITCNFEFILSSTFILKHLIFLLAMCIHENIEFQTGLTEVSATMWDALSNITCPVEVYTHHEVLLEWTFRNPQFNSFSSFVLQAWMKFSFCSSNSTILQKTFSVLLKLLCNSDVAQETFIRQFDSNSEMSFHFLQNAFESEVYQNEDIKIKEKFVIFIHALVQHIQNCTLRILVVKNHINEKIDDGFLPFGLECMLWCYRKVSAINSQIDMKFVFHVTNFCCNSSFEDCKTLILCLKLLQFVSSFKDHDSREYYKHENSFSSDFKVA
ncbi:unnamed protein product [Larinioides sclopetarius]